MLEVGAFILGIALASGAACIPGLHVYNLLAMTVLFSATFDAPPFEGALQVFFMASVTAYALLNAIPSIVFGAPDESAALTALPGRKMMRAGRGDEAVALSVAGGQLAVLCVVILLWGGYASGALGITLAVIRPHFHWMVWCVIVFMLMSEWPRYHGPAFDGKTRLWLAWRPLLAGVFTFLASGALGFAVFSGHLLPHTSGFLSLLPAFLGLFAAPPLILELLSAPGARPDEDETPTHSPARGDLVAGVASGVAGGAFAAVLPAVTAGVGGLLSGHAFGVRGDRTFLISQGAARAAYYVGSLGLLFVPGLNLRRGGAANMLRSLSDPWTPLHFYRAMVAAAFAAALCALLWRPLLGLSLAIPGRWGRRPCSRFILAGIAILAVATTGLPGLLVFATASAIGLVPLLYGSRRMNALGVVLLPVACGLSGLGDWTSLAGGSQ